MPPHCQHTYRWLGASNLGLDVFPSLFSISSKNFQGIMKRMEVDLERWTRLPISLQTCRSIVKMDILPRVYFYSNKIPIFPSTGYWGKMHSITSKFLWEWRRPHVKLSTLQRNKHNGSLAVPNFKFYSWSYVLHPLSSWLDPQVQISWKPIEKHLASPHWLQDLI